MIRPRPCLTLTTDFGDQDGYVGAMKGAILRIHPRAILVDITHGIPPQDVRAAAFVVLSAYAAFPPGAIHLVVVDPGVGTPRRLVAARLGQWTFLAPDNGVLDLVRRREGWRQAVAITNRRYAHAAISRTFHGRDILAPAAAYLARGLPLRRLGPSIAALHPLAWPTVRRLPDGGQRGVVVHVDRFGNLITNLTLPAGASAGWVLRHRRDDYPVAKTYADAPRNAILALAGGSGFVELAARNGSARARLQARRGDAVELRRASRAGIGNHTDAARHLTRHAQEETHGSASGTRQDACGGR